MIHEYTLCRIITIPLLLIVVIVLVTITLLTLNDNNKYDLFCNITTTITITTNNDIWNYSSWKTINNQFFLYCTGQCTETNCFKFNDTNCKYKELINCN